jgi:hypothetical protein
MKNFGFREEGDRSPALSLMPRPVSKPQVGRSHSRLQHRHTKVGKYQKPEASATAGRVHTHTRFTGSAERSRRSRLDFPTVRANWIVVQLL